MVRRVMKDYEVLRKAVETYGKEAQTDMMIEEMSELTKALLKQRRNGTSETVDNVLEEMADVEIMLNQMKMIYGDTTKYRVEKIARLASRLGIEEDVDFTAAPLYNCSI